MKKLIIVLTITSLLSCDMIVTKKEKEIAMVEVVQPSVNDEVPFVWENANIYFLLTDRFKMVIPQMM